ncbi:MAG: hypothetical protein EXR55_06980 [Dehalococcoidia bacterium]|nr:hypothetical protein [Dehalococcoidia bacterium]
MADRTLLRIGSLSAIIGSILSLVGNILFPRADDPTNVTAFLEKAADSSIWVGAHIGILVGVLLTTGELVAL